MKILKLTALTAAFAFCAGTAQAQHVWDDSGTWMSGHFIYEVKVPRYTAYELSMDLFASYQAAEEGLDEIFDTSIEGGDWGGGLGLNYFFTRYIGLGADVNAPDNRGNFIDQINGNLLLRLPLGGSGWAPYIFGGGGRGTDPEWEWLAHAGLGLEYRWNPTTGIFLDGRYVWPEETFDRLVLRAGFRIIF